MCVLIVNFFLDGNNETFPMVFGPFDKPSDAEDYCDLREFTSEETFDSYSILVLNHP